MTNQLTKSLIIAVDFDGTCVTHEFPAVGKDVPGAVKVLKRLVEAGHKLILYTMRSERTDNFDPLQDAVNWFKERNIELWGINHNHDQHKWTKSPKVYAHIYIDDAALGMPLIKDDLSVRPYVDWGCIEIMLETAGVLPVAADRNTRKIAFALREANFFPLVNCINAEHNPSTQRP